MPDNVADFAAERGIGALERRVRLGGRLPAKAMGELPVELCLAGRGVWLIAASGRFSGTILDLCRTSELRYEAGRLRDRLLLGEHVLSVPAGRAAEARRCIALGRLRHERPSPQPSRIWTLADRYLTHVDQAVTELIASELKNEDVLVAVARLAPDVETTSSLGAQVKQSTFFVMTAERAFSVRLSELGDAIVEALAQQALRVSSHGEHLLLTDGRYEFSIPTKTQSLYAELAELSQLAPAERLYEAARRLWLASRELPRPLELVRAAALHESPLAPIAELGLRLQATKPEPGISVEAALVTLEREQLAADAAAEVWLRWEFSGSSGREVVNLFGAVGARAEPWALCLHRQVVETKDPQAERPALLDLELAEHELLAGEPERARTLSEARLLELGPDEDALLGPERATLSHLERVRLYEVLVKEAELREASSVWALSALCRLEPASEPRLRSLAHAASGDETEARILARAKEVLECVAPGGLSAVELTALGPELRSLDSRTLNERVRHPLGRGSGRLAARVSELVASVPEPDLGFLRDFCEELTESRHPDAVRALKRATRLLGLAEITAYVSHGARSVGLRAFGSREPFVLVGASHLAPDSAQSLHGRELDFALGAELSHLAFGHQRVTVSEVWAGAAGKTRDVLLALGVLLPVVREIGGARAQRILGRLTNEALERALQGAARLPELFGRTLPETPSVRALGQHNEELILAHRLVQLSADRAGLISAEKLAPSLRAMLLTRSEYRPLLERTREHGLFRALAERQAEGPAFIDLSVRVRALIAFYLGLDFDAVLKRPVE